MPNVTMNVTKITIIERVGHMGALSIHTDLPSPSLAQPKDNACFLLYTTRGTGEDYAKTNFPGVPVEVINS